MYYFFIFLCKLHNSTLNGMKPVAGLHRNKHTPLEDKKLCMSGSVCAHLFKNKNILLEKLYFLFS